MGVAFFPFCAVNGNFLLIHAQNHGSGVGGIPTKNTKRKENKEFILLNKAAYFDRISNRQNDNW